MTATLTLVPVSFDQPAMTIVKAYQGLDKAQAKLTAIVNQTFQGYLDTWFISNGKSEASVKAMGKAIRESQVVLDIVASGAMEKKTFTEYAQSAMRALHWGVPFSADLKNKPEYALPGGKAAKPSTKAGTVEKTNLEAVCKTLQKALAQMRTLGLDDVAADTLDAVQSHWDWFSETPAAK
jgi:hypothetical protein